MQIVCPNCTTSYQIADMAVGAGGRSVRCVRCQNVWRVSAPAVTADEAPVAAVHIEAPAAPEPPSPVSEPAEAIAAEAEQDAASAADAEPVEAAGADGAEDTAPVALSDIPIPVEPGALDGSDAAPSTGAEIDNSPPDIESVAARRMRPAASRKQRRSARWAMAAAIAALMLVSASLLSFRKTIVQHAPQLASFYSAIHLPVNLRGLAFTDLKIGNEIHDGVPVLVIEGLIVSTTSKTATVPRLRFALRSVSGAEVYSWTAPPAQPTLGAFETLPFRSRLASPPAEGHDVEVRFFNHRDAVASLR
jgi:predicted Zn finger-like uncharacterized protein